MRTRVVAASVIFYVVVAALLLGVLFEVWPDVLPKALSTRIGHNSEGYTLALVLGAWIQFVRPRLAGHRSEWIVTVIVALAFVGLTVYLLTGDGVASRFKTLNEATLAAALLVPFVQIRRPLPKYAALLAAIVLIVVTIVTNRTSTTTDLAETYGMLVLTVVGLDLVDRGILDPTARTSPPVRWIWYAILVVAPIVFSVAEYQLDAGTTGIVGGSVRFLVRITEAFIAALFVEVFFALGLGRTGRSTIEEPASAEASAASPAVSA